MANEPAGPTFDPSTPVPVTIEGAVKVAGIARTAAQAGDAGSYGNMSFLGTAADDKVMILGEDVHRKVARIACSGVGPVFVGTEAQCAAIKAGGPTSAGGFILATGMTIEITHRQPVWVISDLAHTATVSVLNERWSP